MNVKESKAAISLLFDKLNTIRPENLYHWKIEARSITEQIFGKESHEYKSIGQFYRDESYSSDPEKIAAKKKEIESLKSLRQIFTNTLSIKGVYKPPQSNMVSHLNNWQILGCIVAIYLAGFGTYKVIDEVSSKKSATSMPSNAIPNNISNADTNSKHDTERYEKFITDSTKLAK